MENTVTFECPVCTYPYLHEPPYSKSGSGSYEICPSCGFEFGVTDDDQGYSHWQWRKKWMDKGMPWMSRKIRRKPDDWNPQDEL